GILLRDILIEANSAEIFPDVLFGVAIGTGNAAGLAGSGEKFRSVRYRPQREQRLHAGNRGCAGGCVGHQREIAEAKILPEAFVVTEDEGFVFAQRAAERAAEDVALEVRDASLIEEIAGVERGV